MTAERRLPPAELGALLGDLGIPLGSALLSRRPGAGDEYLCLPSPSRPQLLVPLRPSGSEMVLQRRSAGRRALWTKRATAALLRSPHARHLPLRRLVVTDPALRELAEWAVGRPDVEVGVLSGPPRANRKPVLRLAAPSGETVAYAKVGVNALTGALVRAEEAALTEVDGARLPGLVVPQVVRSGRWRGLEVLVTSPLGVGAAGRHPHDLPVEATRALFGHRARTDLALRATAPLRGEPGPAAELESHGRVLLDLAGDRRLATGAAHGDWTPWNMALRAGSGVDVWDWERFATDVPAGLDVIHFEAARVSADDDFAATDAFLAAVPHRLADCGLAPGDAGLLLATYFFDIGRRYAADLQHHHAPRAAKRLAWVTELLGRQLRQLDERVTR